MSEIEFGGQRYEVEDEDLTTESDDDVATHYRFGELTICETKIEFPAFAVDPETMRLLTGAGPVARTAGAITINRPGKRIWWKPWRRRPTVTYHFRATTLEEGP